METEIARLLNCTTQDEELLHSLINLYCEHRGLSTRPLSSSTSKFSFVIKCTQYCQMSSRLKLTWKVKNAVFTFLTVAGI